MNSYVLCDEGLQVCIDGGGDRTLLAIQDGSSIRFWADTSDIEDALEGQTMQLSAHGGYCCIDVANGFVHIEFGMDGRGRKDCQFPVQKLVDALKRVRALPTPVANPSDMVLQLDRSPI